MRSCLNYDSLDTARAISGCCKSASSTRFEWKSAFNTIDISDLIEENRSIRAFDIDAEGQRYVTVIVEALTSLKREFVAYYLTSKSNPNS